MFSSRKVVFRQWRFSRDGRHPPEAGHELRPPVERPRKSSGTTNHRLKGTFHSFYQKPNCQKQNRILKKLLRLHNLS